MNVGQLKDQLDLYPDNMDVFIEQLEIEFSVSLLNSVTPKKVTFQDGKLKAKGDCLVLSDEN